jgi:hypothetical protein
MKQQRTMNNSLRYDVMHHQCHKVIDGYQHYAPLSTAALPRDRKRVCYRVCTVMSQLQDYSASI